MQNNAINGNNDEQQKTAEMRNTEITMQEKANIQ